MERWSDWGENGGFFYPISIVEKEQILEECKKICPKAIVTIASDLAAVTVNYVASRLGLTCNSEHSVRISSNKYEMRNAFRTTGIDTPFFSCIQRKMICRICRIFVIL